MKHQTLAPMASPISSFSHRGRENQSIITELETTLLVSDDPFPYFMIIAFEAGGPFRSLLLFLTYPLILTLTTFHFKRLSIQISIFVSMAGLRMSDVKAVAKANLPRFFLEDLAKEGFLVFRSCGGLRCVVTCMPRILVEPFLREYMDVDIVVGTEIRSSVGGGGYCIGLVDRFGFVKEVKENSNQVLFDVGLCNADTKDLPFMSLCKEKFVRMERKKKGIEKLPRNLYPKPLTFHDGRLVSKPTPTNILVLLLWLPLGIILALVRVLIGLFLPYKLILPVVALTGLQIRPEIPEEFQLKKLENERKGGRLYVCSHRTLLDPVMISVSLQRRVTAVTYSLSRISEMISPIPNFRLTRDRVKDGETMRSLLAIGDLVVCPEGTTCREPYLLRFSPLFTEVAEEIVPVAVAVEGVSMFYGTTVRGYKWLDSFFFLMNPMPIYKLKFLAKVSSGENCGGCYVDVANHVQKLIGDELGFQCTMFTRRDKYRMIAGNDGVVA